MVSCELHRHNSSREHSLSQVQFANIPCAAMAAINGRADALVTYNVADFAGPAERSRISVLRPGDLLKKVKPHKQSYLPIEASCLHQEGCPAARERRWRVIEPMDRGSGRRESWPSPWRSASPAPAPEVEKHLHAVGNQWTQCLLREFTLCPGRSYTCVALCVSCNRAEHAAENPAMYGIERVPVE
jgi:hypothetical protein